MKRFGSSIIACIAIAIMLAMHAPVAAGQSGGGHSGSTPNTKCVVAFAKTFPKVLSSIVKCADPASISIQYDVDAKHLRYAAKICFCAKSNGKVDKYRCWKGRYYCVIVKCGWVISCNESNGQPNGEE